VCREDPHVTSGLFRFYPSTVAGKGTSDKIHEVAVQPTDDLGTVLEMNQLKYACRQLYNETKTLAFTHSNLLFENSVDVVAFLKALPISIHIRLGTLPIQDKRVYSSILRHKPVPEWAELVTFCKATPTITIRIQLKRYEVDRAPSILCQGLVLAMWVRADQVLINKITTDVVYKKNILDALLYQDGVSVLNDAHCLDLPPSIRSFPSTSVFDEVSFKKWHNFLAGAVLPGVPNGLEDWVPIARDIIEQGV
jgi:hypothetical protein